MAQRAWGVLQESAHPGRAGVNEQCLNWGWFGVELSDYLCPALLSLPGVRSIMLIDLSCPCRDSRGLISPGPVLHENRWAVCSSSLPTDVVLWSDESELCLYPQPGESQGMAVNLGKVQIIESWGCICSEIFASVIRYFKQNTPFSLTELPAS